MTASDPFRLGRTAPSPWAAAAARRVPDDRLPQQGRSTLLRAGLRTPGRPRRYLARALVLAVLLAAVTALVVAVATVWFRPDGPARWLYVLHDTVWLPLRGRLWVAPFPGGLLWLVPALGLSLLVLVEFTGAASPLRRVQVAGIGLALRGRFGGALVLWDGVLRSLGGRAGQVRAVAVERRDAARDAVIAAIEADAATAPAAALLHAEAVLLRLSEGTAADHVSALEAISLARLGGSRGSEALVAVIAAKAGADATHWRDKAEACRTGMPDLAEVLAAAEALATSGTPADEAAVRTLQVALAASEKRQAALLVWFDVWARRRTGTDAAAAAGLARAETMIAFEFWAARAEAAIRRPATPGLLSEAFADHTGPRLRGEVFARTGTDAAKPGAGG
ncbi:MAG: hypothetical protein ACT4OK_15500 [Gemmobacter sp.]